MGVSTPSSIAYNRLFSKTQMLLRMHCNLDVEVVAGLNKCIEKLSQSEELERRFHVSCMSIGGQKAFLV